MSAHASSPVLLVFVIALIAVGAYVFTATRVSPDDRSSANARYAVAGFSLLLGVLAMVRLLAPIVTYSLLCLGMTSIYAFDLVREERLRTVRVASLAPRGRLDTIPAIWIGTAVASTLMLVPYFLLGEEVVAASIVTACALAMATIAYRILGAPMLLCGGDAATERLRDRARRSTRVGLTCVVAIGTVFVFISFVNGHVASVTPAQQALNFAALALWAVLWVWQSLRVRRLDAGASAGCA